VVADLYVYKKIGLVGGELKNPIRDIPRVINGAMSIVISGFVLLNIAVYIVLPMEVIREKNTVAVVSLISVYFRASFATL
jgi:L-type amino acid transporter 6